MKFLYDQKNITYLYLLIAIVYGIGLFIPLMENDSAQHAVMAMRMYLNNNLFDFYKGPNPYLDKPHMHFWLSTISYKIFGLHQWAYRIPAILFTILGAFSCYQLTKKLYGKSIAHFGSLIFLTSQSIILANHDVRTDAVLTGATIFAIWQLFEYVSTKKILHIVLGAIGAGISFSTKGFYGVGIIGFSILAHIFYTKKFVALVSYKILIGLLVFILTISPVLYAYYHQFGTDGIAFILWNQNVNRITATGFEENSPDYSFFFHSLLWVFLPWAFLMYFGLFYQIKKWIKNKYKQTIGIEFLTIGGILITLLVISFSKFKLPHYLNPLIPLLAIFTAGVLYNLKKEHQQKTLNIFVAFLYFSAFILVIGASLLLFLTFTFPSLLTILIYIIFLLLLFFTLKRKELAHKKILVGSVVLMVFVNVILNFYFYPQLLNYQGGMGIAKIINNQKIDSDNVFIYPENYSWTLDFYTQRNTPEISLQEIKDRTKETWVFFKEKKTMDNLLKKMTPIKQYSVDHFRVTKLSLPFLNPKTRQSRLDKVYLVKVK